MMPQRHHVPHKLCPKGHRHLFNVFGALSDVEARSKIGDIFGHKKALAAVIVPGHRRGIDVPGAGWIYHTTGFTAFLPLDYKDVK